MSTRAIGSFTPSVETGFGVSAQPEPSLKNRFTIPVGDEYTSHSYNYAIGPYSRHSVAWQNPFLKQVITPYVPSADVQPFIAKCEQAFNKTQQELAALSPAVSFFVKRDVAKWLLPFMDQNVKDVVILLRVNKCTYVLAKAHLAEKPNSYWQAQLSNKLPTVRLLSSNLCKFSAREQFEIISSRLHAETKPFLAKLERNELNCKTLKARLEKIASEEEVKYAENIDSDEDTTMPTHLSDRPDYGYMRSELKSISGEDYDPIAGTSTSLGTGSEQWDLQRAIRILVPEEFNDQLKFEEVIQQSEAGSNTTSASSDAMVIDDEDYSSDEDPGPQTLIPLKTPVQLLPKEYNTQE